MKTPLIRQATATDAVTVGRQVSNLLCELVPDRYSPENSSDREAVAQVLLAQEKIWAFLAFDRDTAVGVLTLQECHAIYAGGAFGEISELYVLPDYRSYKVGELLIRSAAAFARDRGWGTLEVGAPDLPRWQRSVDFYKAQGFVEIGPRLELEM